MRTTESGLILPPSYRNAQLSKKIVFYKHVKTGRITMGFPEEFQAPRGQQKIVCTSAAEAERWSQRMRDQDRLDEEMTEYERELVEGPMRDYARKELQTLMANARNPFNRDFCEYALKQIDEKEAKGKMIRLSYLHSEAFESGK